MTVHDLLGEHLQELKQHRYRSGVLAKALDHVLHGLVPLLHLQREAREGEAQLDDDAPWAARVRLERHDQGIAQRQKQRRVELVQIVRDLRQSRTMLGLRACCLWRNRPLP